MVRVRLSGRVNQAFRAHAGPAYREATGVARAAGGAAMTGARLGVMPPLPPARHLHRRSLPSPFPLDEPNCHLLSCVRHDLWHGVYALGLESSDEVLVPAYHYGSKVQALLEAGLRCGFCEATETLEPDEDELERLHGGRLLALYLAHFLGFPEDARRWRAWFDKHGLILIEDAAQAWLSERDGHPVGSFEDCFIYGLYKTYGLPDGGELLTTQPPARSTSKSGSSAAVLARRHGARCEQRWGWLAALRRGDGRTPYDPVEDFALGEPDAAPAPATLRLVARLDAKAALRQRSSPSAAGGDHWRAG